jgi:proteasome assembly chaperone (PAC2) family protein
MDYNTEENYNYFLEKIIDLEIKNRKLNKQNKEFENMHKSAQEIIKNLKLENTTLRTNNKELWNKLNTEK